MDGQAILDALTSAGPVLAGLILTGLTLWKGKKWWYKAKDLVKRVRDGLSKTYEIMDEADGPEDDEKK